MWHASASRARGLLTCTHMYICAWWSHRASFGRGYGGVGRTSVTSRLTHTHTHTHTHTRWTNRCPLTLRDLLRCWSTQLLPSSPGVPVLLLWVPVEELRVLLLCDSGSCVSCLGPLLPLSSFLSKVFFSFSFSGLDLHLRWPRTHFTVPFAQQEREINQMNFCLMRTAFIFLLGVSQVYDLQWTAPLVTLFCLRGNSKYFSINSCNEIKCTICLFCHVNLQGKGRPWCLFGQVVSCHCCGLRWRAHLIWLTASLADSGYH